MDAGVRFFLVFILAYPATAYYLPLAQRTANPVVDPLEKHTRKLVLSYEGTKIVLTATGKDYEDLRQTYFTDDRRVYAYLRVETGDEMSRRALFAFITWIGRRLSPLKQAQVSTDKAFVKHIFTEYGKEFLFDDFGETGLENIMAVLKKASGAVYGKQ